MIKDLKDLQKLLNICRKQGITELKLGGGLEIKFGELPQKNSYQGEMEQEEIIDPYANFPSEVMTPEQLSHYANGGTPDNDPFIKEAL